jgi:hypothetical protein
MIINGNMVNNKIVWQQNISVAKNTLYFFTTWVSSVHPLNPAQLQFSVNGSLLGSIFSATSDTINHWEQFYATWSSGRVTTANISIVNKNIIANGNDFGLDNISFITCIPSESMPVELLSLTVSEYEGNIRVTWNTSSETNNNYFLLERSLDLNKYDLIGKIEGSNNSNTIKTYSYIDKDNVKGDYVYYRLKQVDYDGKSKYVGLIAYELLLGKP